MLFFHGYTPGFTVDAFWLKQVSFVVVLSAAVALLLQSEPLSRVLLKHMIFMIYAFAS